MGKYVRMSDVELAKVVEYLGGICDEEYPIVESAGIVVDPEWARTQEWACWIDEAENGTIPDYLVRTMDDSNTGANWLVSIDGSGYRLWGAEDTDMYGSAPAYQGCFGIDPDTTPWVESLYEDAEDVWM